MKGDVGTLYSFALEGKITVFIQVGSGFSNSSKLPGENFLSSVYTSDNKVFCNVSYFWVGVPKLPVSPGNMLKLHAYTVFNVTEIP